MTALLEALTRRLSESQSEGTMSTKMLLSTMACDVVENPSIARYVRLGNVVAAPFQPLGAAASFQRGKRAKRLYFHTVSKTCVAPRGSYSAIFGCLVETLLTASFAWRNS